MQSVLFLFPVHTGRNPHSSTPLPSSLVEGACSGPGAVPEGDRNLWSSELEEVAQQGLDFEALTLPMPSSCFSLFLGYHKISRSSVIGCSPQTKAMDLTSYGSKPLQQ